MKNNIFILILVFVGLGNTALSEILQTSEDSIRNYFTKRIERNAIEHKLIPYGRSEDLQKEDIAQLREHIWNLWVETVRSSDDLPQFSHLGKNEEEPQLHSWELIDEDPMPFFLVQKGDSKEPLSLFLNLHGSGPKDLEFRATIGWSMRYKDSPSLYFIPQIPSEARYRWWLKPVQYSWERLFRLAMINEQISPNRLYVMGISEGGYGSQRLGAFYADYLAGAGPMAGGEPLENAPPLNYRNIAFSFHTGEHDKGFGRNEFTLLAKNVFDSLENEFPGQFVHNIVLQKEKGHAIDYTQTTPWLTQYTRNAHPNHISWLLFPMDGRYRKGFYNIAIDEPFSVSEDQEFDRVSFDIKYEKDNVIRLDAHITNKNLTKQKVIDEGKLSLFLDEKYVNLYKKVKVIINGTVVIEEEPQLSLGNLVESCALFGDPERIFPGKIQLDFNSL